jgi:hypothetical protein
MELTGTGDAASQTASPRGPKVFEWSPSFEIGVPEIDGQYRSLFERADQFAVAVQARRPMHRLEEPLGFLAEYALELFASEERYMREVRAIETRDLPNLGAFFGPQVQEEVLESSRNEISARLEAPREGEAPTTGARGLAGCDADRSPKIELASLRLLLLPGFRIR